MIFIVSMALDNVGRSLTLSPGPAGLLRRGGDMGGPPGEILAFVARGVDRELREVFALVRSKPEQMAEEDADDE
jgi:hypothetical protein